MSQVQVEKKVLNENQIVAAGLREKFQQHGIFCFNIISSPGSGKTSLLERTLERLPKHSRVAVLVGDLQTENDAKRLERFGFPVRQIITGGTLQIADPTPATAAALMVPDRSAPTIGVSA